MYPNTRPVKRFLQLFRLGNCLMGVIGLLVAAFIASGTGMLDHWQHLLASGLGVALFIAAGNALNDYVDREVDLVAHPERPIPSGRLQANSALYASAALFTLSIICSLFLDPLSIFIFVAALALMIGYELQFKASGLLGNIVIAALTGALFLLGGAVVGSIGNTLAVAGMAALATLGREIVKDIEDMEGDEGRLTLPMRIGTRRAGLIAASFFILGPILSMQPVLAGVFGPAYLPLVLVADAIFLYDSWLLFKDPQRAQRLAKVAMLIALLAFIAGGFR